MTDDSTGQPDASRPTGRFPTVRMRRLRMNPAVRRLVRRTYLRPDDFILPLFVRRGRGIRGEISSMPGNYQLSPDMLAVEVEEAARLGLAGVILFGIPERKDAVGSESLDPEGIIPEAVRAVREAAGTMLIITDLCFCEYTDHGHCGPLRDCGGRVDVDNDATLELLGRQAVVHAASGADMIAPSGMMDGMVWSIRNALDAAGFEHIPIMSYSAKYAGSFYGPFREAARSAPRSGDRRSYQMDFSAAAEQALREVELDLAEGADIFMVKPALAYLDIVKAVRDRFPEVPLAAYNVSGEFSMVKAAAAKGWIDERGIVMESLIAMKRAGADCILTYWAKDAARWLSE